MEAFDVVACSLPVRSYVCLEFSYNVRLDDDIYHAQGRIRPFPTCDPKQRACMINFATKQQRPRDHSQLQDPMRFFGPRTCDFCPLLLVAIGLPCLHSLLLRHGEERKALPSGRPSNSISPNPRTACPRHLLAHQGRGDTLPLQVGLVPRWHARSPHTQPHLWLPPADHAPSGV